MQVLNEGFDISNVEFVRIDHKVFFVHQYRIALDSDVYVQHQRLCPSTISHSGRLTTVTHIPQREFVPSSSNPIMYETRGATGLLLYILPRGMKAKHARRTPPDNLYN